MALVKGYAWLPDRREAVMRWGMAAALALLLGIPAAAWGQVGVGIELDYGIEEDGRGVLTAHPFSSNPQGNPLLPLGNRVAEDASVSWSSCPDRGDSCVPVAGDPPKGRKLYVGDAPAGTVFEVTASYGDQTTSQRSVPYLGRLTATAPPGLIGRLAVRAYVHPTEARWTGGWGREQSTLQTQVCRDREGRRCVVIADQPHWAHCPSFGAALDPEYEGWYVRVIDRRLDRDVGFPLILYTTPEALHPFRPSGTAAAATFGPIGPLVGAPESKCGLYPRARVLRRAKRTRAGAMIGWVRCPGACRVGLIADGASRTVKQTLRVPGWSRRPLVLSHRTIARLGGRRVRVLVRFSPERDVGGTVVLPRRR